MLADGSFVLGEWTASGAPETTANLSPLNTGGYRINGTDVITSSRNIQQVGTITLGANGIIDTASGHIIFKSGGGTQGQFISTGFSLIGSYSATANFNTSLGGYQIGGTTVIDSSRNLTNIGTYAGNGDITLTSGSNQVLLAVTNGALEITRSAGGPFIDFKNSTSDDFDSRIMGGNALIFSTGGNGSTATALTLGSNQSATFTGDISLAQQKRINLGGLAFARMNSSGNFELGDVDDDDREVRINAFAGTSRIDMGDGSVAITGALSKSSGSFKIDHPLKPDTHDLVHSFVEGPQADNLYRGVSELINGKIVIDLDDYFDMTSGTFLALNRDIQAFVNNEDDWDLVKGKVMGSQLIIESKNKKSSAKVSWLVIGERQDKEIYESTLTDNSGRIIVEPEKVN